ncbi:hypothetical protein GALMADRAFT_251611 [Galerina marginata CBS 339.88]|uniref:Secreted protein n=1 Tax=Galerina marginata (strain CBS 339.88) TaxID=685588 RepID=A0A067SSD2_GALM3|nr:hypothetical protein GALMADRAFT_251611 [Galerina marginata CBS 339.88]
MASLRRSLIMSFVFLELLRGERESWSCPPQSSLPVRVQVHPNYSEKIYMTVWRSATGTGSLCNSSPVPSVVPDLDFFF